MTDGQPEARPDQTEVDELQRRAEAAEAALHRLRSRRSVRVALAAARLTQPLFVWLRSRSASMSADAELAVSEAAKASGSCLCPACERPADGFAPGPGGRANAKCPHCGALERHRFLAVLLKALSSEVGRATGILEVAPTPAVTQLLGRRADSILVGMDIDPAADGRSVNLVGDMCAAPIRDDAFDLAICFHVLEHIPDDLAAMKSLARILAPEGLGFVQVPWNREGPTDEDPSASAEERARRFGQADHVRVYGLDFEDRMRSAGLDLVRVEADRWLDVDERRRIGVRGVIWVIRPTSVEEPTRSGKQLDGLVRRRLATGRRA